MTDTKLRVATRNDLDEIFSLCRMMHTEGGYRRPDINKVRLILLEAIDGKNGVLAVIGPPGNIRAMIMLRLAQLWYTSELHLEELFCWVHPNYRNSDYAKVLIDYAKAESDRLTQAAGIKVPLIIGITTNKRMTGKVRLYRRFLGVPLGAYFGHNLDWVTHEPSEIDWWRVPKAAKWLARQIEHQCKMAS